MVVLIQLVHAETGRRVVLASAMEQDRCIAAALGEAGTAEEAEERARSRLATRIAKGQPPQQPSINTDNGSRTDSGPLRSAVRPEPASQPAMAGTQDVVQRPAPTKPEIELGPSGDNLEPEPDPEDWSGELANLELQLRRLGWDRDQEATYLQRAFGHGSRARLTRYSDLLAYLQALTSLAPGSDPQSCAVPLRRSDLLQHSDQLLGQLGWDASRGRQMLESHFRRSSRQQLNDNQLLEFNMLLESELLGTTSINATGVTPNSSDCLSQPLS